MCPLNSRISGPDHTANIVRQELAHISTHAVFKSVLMSMLEQYFAILHTGHRTLPQRDNSITSHT